MTVPAAPVLSRAPVSRPSWSRDRLVFLAGLLAVCAAAWVHVLSMSASAGAMGTMATVALPMPEAWDAAMVGSLLVMWTIMMVAMMLPSAIPAVLLFQRVSGRDGAGTNRAVVFAVGYLLVWLGYSAGASALQWSLHELALLSPMDALVSPWLGGAVLATAGLYQFLPMKHRCLVHCRSPMQFFMLNWREGTTGALTLGLQHGGVCVGCCWSLMLLLFVGGVMNPAWVAMLSALVLTEKVLARGRWISYGLGMLLVGWGVASWDLGG